MSPERPAEPNGSAEARAARTLGSVAGAAAGLLGSYGLFALWIDGYPTEIGTFVLVAGGALLGGYAGRTGGARAFRPLGLAAGVLVAGVVVLALVAWMGSSRGP